MEFLLKALVFCVPATHSSFAVSYWLWGASVDSAIRTATNACGDGLVPSPLDDDTFDSYCS